MKRYGMLLTCLFGLGICYGCGSDSQPTDPPSSAGEATGGDSESSDNTSDAAGEPQGDADETTAGDAAGAEPTRKPVVAADAIVPPDRINEVMQERNPGFAGTVHFQPYPPNSFAVGIQDPNVKDISALKGHRIGALELSGCDVQDLGPLEGMPIDKLYLEGNQRLSNLGPLRNMPLQELYLSNTRVENLGPLRGAPLTTVNLVATRVKDLSPLAESPIQMLWLTDCPVKDLSPLKSVPLVSLTLENCPVEDLSPLENHRLQRLHIAGTQVTDLTPLSTTALTRLVFTPERIKKGIEVTRQMPSLQELGTQFNDQGRDLMPPVAFWAAREAGPAPPE